ncbi:MAG: DinB family protein [Bacteroidota bacterium]
MYENISEFLNDWSRESQATLKVLSAISDESLCQKVYNDGRTLGDIAWHIVDSVGEMAGGVGVKLKRPEENSPVPSSAEEITALYQSNAVELLKQIEETWQDSNLTEEVDMYGETWTKGLVLHIVIRHEIHHRGQLTILMRQAGLKVPGVYGPAKEEWADMNMQAPR